MAEHPKLTHPAHYEGPGNLEWVKVSEVSEIAGMSPDEIWDNFSEGTPEGGFTSWDFVSGELSREKTDNFGERLIPLSEGKYVAGLSKIGVRNMRPSTKPGLTEFKWE